MSFLLMTLQAKYSPVLMCTASLTIAYVPLPRVLPVLYCRNTRSVLQLMTDDDRIALTWQGTVAGEGIIDLGGSESS